MPSRRTQRPGFAREDGKGLSEKVSRFNDLYLYRLPGGSGLTAPRVPINIHKVTIGAVVLALMWHAEDVSLAAWLDLALHGSYGLFWLVKDVAFPDPAWRAPQSLASAFGVFLHFGADARKHLVLARGGKKRLITDGFFAATRNPNDLGEILIYSSFCLLARHWLPWAGCLLVWLGVFLPNMLRKERSMARHPEHAAWVARTGFLLPSLPTLLRALPGAFRPPRE